MRRRRNLIILRGICTAIVTLLGVFSTIAIADYLSQARMPDALRTTLSYLGYAVVVLAAYTAPGFYWSCQAAENSPA